MSEGQRRKGQRLPIKKKSDLSADLFLAFQLSFRFLSQVYSEAPDKKFIENIFSNNLFFEWPVGENQKNISKGLKILQDYSGQWKPDLMESLKQDYAPPYASVYLGKDFLLYEKPVLDVRQFYKNIGLYVNPKKNEPDDHIGFELFCLSYLCEKTDQAALSEFLSDHLNPWLNSFMSNVLDKAQTSFYRGLAFLTLGLVEVLSDCLDIKETKY